MIALYDLRDEPAAAPTAPPAQLVPGSQTAAAARGAARPSHYNRQSFLVLLIAPKG